MTDTTVADPLRRVAKSERIAALDVLRGFAILAILVMNIPIMGGYAGPELNDPRLVSWTAADQAVFQGVRLVLDGTQRALLELLFGAGVMIMTRAAMRPDGPVAVADLHFRRNLWLMVIGAFQALVLFWPGDVLLPYGLVAIFVFPFRTLAPRLKAALGVAFILVAITPGAIEYHERTELKATAAAAQAKVAAKTPLTKVEREKLDEWTKKVDRLKPAAENPKKREAMAEEKKARLGSLAAYAKFTRDFWISFNFVGETWFFWAEIFGTMLLGAALFEWGVLQSRLSAGAYLAILVAGYGLGVTARHIGNMEYLRFRPDPKSYWITLDIARIALTLGHVALFNLALKSGFGRVLLSPFQATGKMPLTTYLGASLICMVILFPGFGFGLFGKFGWAGLEAIALAVMAGQVIFANLWLRAFETGPLEWVWKSLAYRKAQPFRKLTGPAGAYQPAE